MPAVSFAENNPSCGLSEHSSRFLRNPFAASQKDMWASIRVYPSPAWGYRTIMIQLDHNATTPITEAVFEAMVPFLTTDQGNASSDHAAGHVARDAIATARAQVASLIGAQPDEIVFTSGATESSNLAIYGSAKASTRRHIVTTPIEHIATLAPCRDLAKRGYEISLLDVDPFGCVVTTTVPDRLREDTLLVSIMHANNETGSVQDVARVARHARAVGAQVHCDAAQSVGKLPVDVTALDVDLLSIAGHKLYAPKGVGALFVRRGTRLSPFVLGGSQENGLRPGTENVPYIVGLGQACAIAQARLTSDTERVQALRDRLHGLLLARIPTLRLFGHPDERLPNTLTIGFPGVAGHEVLARANRVVASTSAACHAGRVEPSHVLTAMGVAPEDANRMVRLSLGRHTSAEEIHTASTALIQAFEDATR